MTTVAIKPPIPDLFNKYETAEKLRMHPLTVLRLAREKRIDSVRCGNRVMFTAKHIEDYLTRSETKATQPVRKPSRNPRYSK